jgi:hypothetical protein
LHFETNQVSFILLLLTARKQAEADPMSSVQAALDQEYAENRLMNAPLFWGGMALALGSLGVVVTGTFYLLSPVEATMPVVPLILEKAMAGAIAGASTMKAAGAVGIFSDVAIAAGALSIGMSDVVRGRGASAVGWMMIAVSAIIFAVVDALVGFVLSPVAGQLQFSAAFLAVKSLFDALFILGTWTFAAGGALALIPWVAARDRSVSRGLALAVIAIGLIGAVASLGTLFGLPLHHFMGLSIGAGSALFTLIGVQIARGAAAARG